MSTRFLIYSTEAPPRLLRGRGRGRVRVRVRVRARVRVRG